MAMMAVKPATRSRVVRFSALALGAPPRPIVPASGCRVPASVARLNLARQPSRSLWKGSAVAGNPVCQRPPFPTAIILRSQNPSSLTVRIIQ